MSKEQQGFSTTLLEELQTSGAGYDVLRYISLPELLGRETETLLYFMGRNLARKLSFNTIEDIYLIFDKMGWGKLELIRNKRKEITFSLMSDSVVNRIKASFDTEFRLESGFLAEAIQQLKETEAECTEEINKKIMQVEFSVLITA
ncbi:YslB family protein [Virgibacillus flavescens]|uniref:YslB family protein n=1 Tax=Virgibacillus flavescens TaxID=1611422 RepID=UPI003D346833